MTEIVLIAHGNLAECFLKTVQTIAAVDTAGVHVFSVSHEADIDKVTSDLRAIFASAQGGVLVLADLFGGSGCNMPIIAARDMHRIKIISGINMSMVLCALMHRADMSIEDLTAKVEADGKRAILNVTNIIRC